MVNGEQRNTNNNRAVTKQQNKMKKTKNKNLQQIYYLALIFWQDCCSCFVLRFCFVSVPERVFFFFFVSQIYIFSLLLLNYIILWTKTIINGDDHLQSVHRISCIAMQSLEWKMFDLDLVFGCVCVCVWLRFAIYLVAVGA